MVELHAVLMGIVPDGWHYFIIHGRITRLDIAVDFQNVQVNDFVFLANQGATIKQWRVNGQLQTYTHGKPKGNHTAIYDRKEKRIAKGKPWQGKEGIRIERRFKVPPVTKLPELPQMLNPFSEMKMISMPGPPPKEAKPYIWHLFRHAVEVQGLQAALALLPEEKRTLYRKHLAAHTQPWWNPDAIWANWPTMLNELEIASAKAWF
jgi:hypothetical protein